MERVGYLEMEEKHEKSDNCLNCRFTGYKLTELGEVLLTCRRKGLDKIEVIAFFDSDPPDPCKHWIKKGG